MIQTLLIANRGEIARRIIRTCHAMGINTLAVYSDADRDLPHVREATRAINLGGAAPGESYLHMGKLVTLALEHGADAVHPGYGFLSENADFAEACQQAGLTWVGPPPSVIRAMGDKSQAKRLMAEAGVPVIPGYQGEQQDEKTLETEAGRIGYPVLLKAVAGGGGRGIRRVDEPGQLAGAIASARRESKNAFGDDRLLLERCLAAPRHVEFQVIADTHGNVRHLHERECSIQRRHQKLVEEAPSPMLDESLREAMARAAISAAKSIGYVGAGTVEFMLEFRPDNTADKAVGKAVEKIGREAPSEHTPFYFMEMNTRLQVEHPVTEALLGVDLVRLQLEVAQGLTLADTTDLGAGDPTPRGHAIECRLNAEDPLRDYLPATGVLNTLRFPEGEGLRVDAGYAAGNTLTPHYDSLLAKLVAWGNTREEALRRMAGMLAATRVTGIPTNLGLLSAVLEQPGFMSGNYTTGFLAEQEAALGQSMRMTSPPDAELHPPQAGPTTKLKTLVLTVAAVEARLAMLDHPPPAYYAPPHDRQKPEMPPPGSIVPLLRRLLVVEEQKLDVRIRVAPGWMRQNDAEDGSGEILFEVQSSAFGKDGQANPVLAVYRETSVTPVDHGPTQANAEKAVLKGAPIRSGEGMLQTVGGAGADPGTEQPVWWEAQGDSRWIGLGGRLVTVQSRDAGDRDRTVGAGEAAERLRAPLPGKVVEVAVRTGEEVREGQKLMVLEAMKMEHAITAPFAGTVSAVHFSPGDLVNREEQLLEVNPEAPEE